MGGAVAERRTTATTRRVPPQREQVKPICPHTRSLARAVETDDQDPGL